ncbi:MAG: redoxin domain-containing protein [Gemmatimonadetes bacterium]|nr:redoxin domain-containing protein [Gemmatimonadota bacterium]
MKLNLLASAFVLLASPVAAQDLGPADGQDLPGTDLDRVVAGTEAPDFTAVTLDGDHLTLSGFRGEKDVVLFFYRGHW